MSETAEQMTAQEILDRLNYFSIPTLMGAARTADWLWEDVIKRLPGYLPASTDQLTDADANDKFVAYTTAGPMVFEYDRRMQAWDGRAWSVEDSAADENDEFEYEGDSESTELNGDDLRTICRSFRILQSLLTEIATDATTEFETHGDAARLTSELRTVNDLLLAIVVTHPKIDRILSSTTGRVSVIPF